MPLCPSRYDLPPENRPTSSSQWESCSVRILYLHQYFNTPSMAGGTRSYEMARRLVDRGHEVQMITSRRSATGTGWTESEEAGIHVHWCNVPYSNHMSFRRRIQAFFEFAWRAARKAASLPGDLVFATSTPLTIALPAVWAARKQSIPMVFEVRDLWPEMPIAVGALRSRPAIAAARWLERFAYRNAARVVALSPGMKDGVVAAGYPADRVTVIPNSCDRQLFQVDETAGQVFRRRYPWLGDRPLVVYAGTLGLINGVDYLARLAAAVRARDPEVRFLVVGDGREEGRVRREAEQLGVWERNFFMLPPIPKAEMPALLSAADLATSLFLDIEQMWANSANKLFDALAAGRPIAINHQGWLADMIHETGCGLVLDPHDLASAADRLVSALHDRFWLAGARRAAGQAAEERFDRDRLAAQLEAVLLDVVPPTARRMAA
jgi:glycosyltransferase involved in cell wall biosynthesis